jgi:fibro-slime domain-containing protein
MKQLSALTFALGLVACGGGGGNNQPDGGGISMGSGSGSGSDGPTCGNGKLDSGEACDDGNTISNDGCSADCQIESGFACGDPGMLCLTDHTCGNGIVEPTEGCDDHNTHSNDGCDANCQLEPGWTCPVAGIRCKAAMCGDGIVAGTEECDDGNSMGSDGCSSTCQLENGFQCPTPNTSCLTTTCGDGMAQGTEECDDGNNNLGDGCDPFCQEEPQCTNGTCVAVCGDGELQAGEQCDDGNLFDFDGCSSTCMTETGYTCAAVTDSQPATLPITIVYRDFKGNDLAGGFVDFQNFNGAEPCLLGPSVQSTDPSPPANSACGSGAYGTLDSNGKPVLTKANPLKVSSAATFAKWYRDEPGTNVTVPDTLTLTSQGLNTYQFSSTAFYPLDTRGWAAVVSPNTEVLRPDSGSGTCPTAGAHCHNYSFTSELRYWFTWAGGEQLSFFGDDDVFVFINGILAVDLGGVHSQENGGITLDATHGARLGMTVGGTYEVVVFQAERHTTGSNYELTLIGFNAPHSVCTSTCGDGITASNEACDDGVNNGGYGSCTADCLGFGPRCGDGIVQADHEQCDDGTNVGGYGHCQPDCTLGPRCGDGIVQADHGEECDDGNDDPTDGCDMCQTPIL